MTRVPADLLLPPQRQASAADSAALDIAGERLPVEELSLPQGVLDLLAGLLLHQRPMAGVGQNGGHRVMITRDGAPFEPVPASASDGPTATRRAAVLPAGEQDIAQAKQVQATLPVIEQNLPETQMTSPGLSLNEAASASSDERARMPGSTSGRWLSALEATTVVFGGLDLPRARPLPANVPILPTLVAPMPLPELAIDDGPVVHREILQVPFNKGAVSGQVNITRTTSESVPGLVLNPGNAQILEQLREPFAQTGDPHWRLADGGEERQQRQGSRQSPKDEQTDTGEPSP